MAVLPEPDVVTQQFEMMEAVNAPISAWETFSRDLVRTLQDADRDLAQRAEKISELQRLLDRVNEKIARLRTR